MKDKKTIMLIGAIALCVIIICVAVYFIFFNGIFGEQSKTEVDSQYKYNTQIPTNTNAPKEGDSQLDKITGYTPDSDQKFLTLPYSMDVKVSDENINIIDIVSIGSYSGKVVYGTETVNVENCCAVVIKNPSDKVLSVASVSVQIDDDKVVSFSPTNLPPKCSSLVLLGNNDVDYSSVKQFDCTLDYAVPQDELPLIKDKVGVDFKDGQFVVTNLTDTNLGDVYVRFKEFSSGNVYLGPTHSVCVKDVKPYETYLVDAPAYIENDCVIIAVENYPNI